MYFYYLGSADIYDKIDPRNLLSRPPLDVRVICMYTYISYTHTHTHTYPPDIN